MPLNYVALSDEVGWVAVGGSGQSTRTFGNGNGTQVRMSTIDGEGARLNLTLGFFKADIEGAEYKMLKGGRKTLEALHPVLCVALQHNEIAGPKFVEEVGGYRLESRLER
jgi:FkbM family methyltransferase